MGVIGDRLYVAGGARGGAALKTLEIYDFTTRKWSKGPSMKTAREHLTGAATGGFFYVLAGRAAGRGNFKVAERYDPRTNRWQQLPPLKHARGGIACGVVHGKIVVFGGEEAGGTIARVERFDPATRKWTRLPDMRTSRHGLGGVARGDRVYAIEGGRQPGFHFSNVIEALDVG
jgi:non-specific serine/threonine protein kinase